MRQRHIQRKSHCERKTQRKRHVFVRDLSDRGKKSLTDQAFNAIVMLADIKNTSS